MSLIFSLAKKEKNKESIFSSILKLGFEILIVPSSYGQLSSTEKVKKAINICLDA